MCQWGAIGMHAAEESFGIYIPAWIKARNLEWLAYSYDGVGRILSTSSADGSSSTYTEINFADVVDVATNARGMDTTYS